MQEKFYVAGFKFHEGMLKLSKDELAEGDLVTLVPDPTNPYDENAIKVLYDDAMIGFVPKAINQKLIPVFEQVDEWQGEVIKTNKEAVAEEPWKAVQILVKADDFEPEEA